MTAIMALETRIPTQVQDFTILPLTVAPQPSFPKQTTHYLYLRPNAPKIPTEDTPRELFLVNVPVDATEAHLRALFADHLGGGRVEDVDFESPRTVGRGIKAPVVRTEARGKKRKRGAESVGTEGEEVGVLPATWDRELHRSGGTAVVRFVDRASAELALRSARHAAKSRREISWPSDEDVGTPLLGLARYRKHHELRYPDHEVLQASVDAYLSAFDAAESEKARKLARMRSVPDEDGFITVTRGARNNPASEGQTKAKEEVLKKRDKKRVGEDFYRFQLREKKKEQAKSLVDGFEEDRRKVEEMRRRKREGRRIRDP